MTDRIKSLDVVLQPDLRDDDAEPIIEAIKQLRGVRAVRPHIATGEDYVAYTNARWDLEQKLWEVLHPKKEK